MTGPPAIPPWIASPLASLYQRVIARRNRRFDVRKGVVEIDRPVISVGNLSVGGTGKTPMVAAIVRLLRLHGHHPAIAMRGYAPRGGISDEAASYARAFPDLPIIAQPDRLSGLLELFATPAGERVDSVILDDGFQHRRLARQLDIVLVDATRSPFDDALLPLGWLREPIESLTRAHALVITRADDAHAAQRLVDRLHAAAPHALLAACRHAWTALDLHLPTGVERHPVEWLAGRRVFAACAIGNPDAFLSQLAHAVGSLPIATLVLPDHDPYSERTRRRLVTRLRETTPHALVITDKDWSKLRHVPADTWPCPVVIPMLDLEWVSGWEGLARALLQSVKHQAEQHEP